MALQIASGLQLGAGWARKPQLLSPLQRRNIRSKRGVGMGGVASVYGVCWWGGQRALDVHVGWPALMATVGGIVSPCGEGPRVDVRDILR